MKKLLSLILMALGLLILSHQAEAASIPRSPKEVYVLTYTTTISTVTPSVSTNAATAASFQPGAVYQVLLATGSAVEYVQLYDSTGTVSTCGALPTGSSYLGPRLFYASTGTATNYLFDPPMMFHNGLVACDSSSAGQSSITYELGRGLSGQ